ncbi:MAG: bile acid:sodium symporter family protein [Flavobacteriales bacterium]|nr:bile acid:sodium symporter family protein [Flavobacteriales bacterium]MDG1766280.1 bile acid:sodium symporter family protein [Flavobacteriales bacterium]
MIDLEQIQLRFSPESLNALNACIALIMFGVSLELKTSDLAYLLKRPKAVLVTMFSQLLLLPAVTALLVVVLEPQSSLGLGMLLVACCPGGNVSNFFTSFAKGNIALSISSTTFSSLLSAVLTPIGFAFWSGLIYPDLGEQQIVLDQWDMIKTIALIIVLPCLLGIQLQRWKPQLSQKLSAPLRGLSFVILMAFIGIALAKNFDYFLDYLGLVFLLVLIQNTAAFLTGYLSAMSFGLGKKNAITTSMETGIQNSGLGLVLIFAFFDGNGAMAFVAAWWGIWHIVAGFSFAMISRRYILTQE